MEGGGAGDPDGQQAAAEERPVDGSHTGEWQPGGYEGGQELRSGASGRVVRGRRKADGAPVVLTYLAAGLAGDEAFREVFEGEAEALAGLGTPYAARFLEYVRDGRDAAVVEEAVDGASLEALVGAHGPLGPEAALAVLLDSLLGLAAAHAAGVLHRHLSPAEVTATAGGGVKLTGFGLAGRGADSGGTMGDPSYLTPERRAGGPATVAGDLHAAAALLHFSLTGAPPDAGGADGAAGAGERVPEPLRPLLLAGPAAGPGGRPGSAAEFAAVAEAVAAAAYGESWQERGRRELAARAGLLLTPPPDTAVRVPLPPQAVPAAAPGVLGIFAGEDASGSEPGGPRFGRRAKILAAAVAAVVVVGVIAIGATASGKDKGSDAGGAPTVPAATTPAPVPTTASPSAAPATTSAAPGPTAAHTTPAPTVRPSTPTAPATASPAGSRSPRPAGTAAPTTAPPATPPAAPAPAAGPHVSSVAFTGFRCTGGRHRTATATVQVRYDGTAAGTLHLTWWRGAGASPQGAVMMTPQTARFPAGSVSYTFTDSFTFTADSRHPYVGLTVTTDPAAASGNGSYQVGCR